MFVNTNLVSTNIFIIRRTWGPSSGAVTLFLWLVAHYGSGLAAFRCSSWGWGLMAMRVALSALPPILRFLGPLEQHLSELLVM